MSAFALGILLGIFNIKIFTVIYLLGALSGIIMLVKRKLSPLIFALLFLVGGIYGIYTDNKTTDISNYADTPCSGEMFVTEIDQLDEKHVRVKATVTKINDEKVRESVLFTIYGINDIDVNKKISFENIKFRVPDDARNDGGFNYRRYLKSIGIRHIASANVNDLKASGSDRFVVLRFFRTLKQEFTRRCEKIWGDSSASGIIPAILVGNDISIPDETKDWFSGAGITHILVASGMHVAVIILIFSILLFPLREKRRLYNLILWAALICFAILVGYTPSMTRAVSTFFIYYIARKLLRSADPVTILFEAMALVLAINPMSIYNLSFQLSFSAVFGLIMFTPHIIERIEWLWQLPLFILKLPRKILKVILKLRNYLINGAAVSASALLGVLPFMIIAFGGSSIFTVLINIVISPFIPLIYGFGIGAVIFNIEPLVTVTRWLCDILVTLAKYTAEIPGNYMSFPESNIVNVAILCFVLACLLRCKVKKFTPFFEPAVFICAMAVMLSAPIISYVPQNKAEVTFLNVEQGDCAIIRMADHKTVIVDTGTESMCINELLPYLERKNILKIDALIISHGDNDHSGGAELLTTLMPVDRVVTSRFYEPEVPIANCFKYEKGEKFSIGSAGFEILSPDKDYNNDNDNSLVVRMDFGKSSFLFTGDAGEDVEKDLENIDADVLKVSHHGAKTASGEEFLKKVSPKYSVISVDKNNSYGHPDETVLKRLKNESEQVFRTDRDKTITITADLNGNLKLTKRLKRFIIFDRK